MRQESTAAVQRTRLFSGSSFERTYSYSRAVVVGSAIFVSGTTGYDYATDALASGAREQMLQLLRNLEAVLAQAQATLADVVRVRIYISDASHYEAIMQVFAERFRGIDPACTTVQAGLFDADILVEMDTDAIANASD